jgi:hypothetical protein
VSKRTSWFISCLVGVSIGLGACETIATDNDQPATITNPTEASRAALQQAVNTALRTAVVLADDALTETDLLTIERSPAQGIGTSPADGRIMDMPIQFRLVISADSCIIIDQRDAARYPLENTSCKAIR